MATDPLGGAFNHHISAMVNRSQQSTAGAQGVVHDQGNAFLFSER